MLEKLFSFVKKIIELFKSASGTESSNAIENIQTAEPKEENIDMDAEQEGKSEMKSEEHQEQASHEFETEWNYGYWKEANTYADIKEALAEAQSGRRPVLIALSKSVGCTNCLNYWRHVVCDGVFGHDNGCEFNQKNHPIVSYAKEKRIVLLHLSPSKLPNVASKIMGKEYDKYLHKPVYYPVYLMVAVKPNLNLNDVPANDKILNAGNDEGDTVDFIMGYVGISGKPVYDCDGNQTELKVKTDSTGWSVFKSNIEAIFSDASKTRGLTLP